MENRLVLAMVILGILHVNLVTGIHVEKQEEVGNKVADFNRVVQGKAFSAFRAVRHPKTGSIFNVELNMSGASAQVVRLRTGSLRRHGFTFNEFGIPAESELVGVYPLRVVLVYRSFTGDNLYKPVNFTLVSPVVGIKVYDAANLSRTDAVPELDFQTGVSSKVTVQVTRSSSVSSVSPLCAAFDKGGNISTFNWTSSSGSGTYTCSANHLGDFALVVSTSELMPAAPAPAPGSSMQGGGSSGRRKRKSNRWKVILAAVLGGLVAAVLLVVVVLMVRRVFQRSRIAKMEKQSDRGEMLQTSLIGSSRAPTAGAARTKPVLESDYAA